MSDNKLSSTFAKNARESIVISESEYKGYDLIDIRTFYVDPAGELAPTRKGVTIRAEKLSEFVASLSAFCIRASPLLLKNVQPISNSHLSHHRRW